MSVDLPSSTLPAVENRSSSEVRVSEPAMPVVGDAADRGVVAVVADGARLAPVPAFERRSVAVLPRGAVDVASVVIVGIAVARRVLRAAGQERAQEQNLKGAIHLKTFLRG